VATAGVAAGAGRTVPSPALGAPALIVSQPTTPLESPLVNRRQTPRERRDLPRRVADRSVAMRRAAGGGLGWLWLLLAIGGGVGGATYYYSKRGFAPFAAAAAADSATAPGAAVPAGSAGAPDAPPGDSAPATRPGGVAAVESTPPGPSAAPEPAPAPARRPAPRAAAPTPPPAPRASPDDTGAVRLVGLPRGSTVMIDEQPVLDPVTRLTAGRHVLAVSAPRFNFFTDTILIRAGDTLELTPELQPIGAPVPAGEGVAGRPRAQRAVDRCAPGPNYSAAGCFDERPKPVEPPFVPLPDGLAGTPRPSQLWVKVSAEGRTVDVQGLRRSDDSTFERAARDFAWSVTWHPALKQGAPVEAWTQMLFPPQPQ
jgi:hypothetical protein